jgi:hypothetical protein
MIIRSVKAELLYADDQTHTRRYTRTDGRENGQTDTMKLIFNFRNFSNAPENYLLSDIPLDELLSLFGFKNPPLKFVPAFWIM